MRSAFPRLLLAVAVCLLATTPGWSGELTPPPATQATPVTIAVFGDSMADGLWGGLFRAWHGKPGIVVLRLAKNGTGLSHLGKYDWLKGTESILADNKPDLAVVTFGLNDRISLVLEEEHKSLFFGNEAWKKAYVERVDTVMGQLHRAGVPTFWIGLPVMRDTAANTDAKLLNGIFQEAATRNGVTFLPIWDVIGSGEQFAAFGKDKDGRDRQVRAEDGTHYTPYGYDLLAQPLMAALASDIARLTSQRQAAALPANATTANAAPTKAMP